MAEVVVVVVVVVVVFFRLITQRWLDRSHATAPRDSWWRARGIPGAIECRGPSGRLL